MSVLRVLFAPRATEAVYAWHESIYDEDEKHSLHLIEQIEIPPDRLCEVAASHQDPEQARQWMELQYENAVNSWDVEGVKLYSWLLVQLSQ